MKRLQIRFCLLIVSLEISCKFLGVGFVRKAGMRVCASVLWEETERVDTFT